MRFFLLAVIGTLTATASAQQVTRFQAVLTNEGVVNAAGVTPTETRFSGVANFTLTEPLTGSPTLAYEILFDGVDFLGTDGDPGNDATAIHLHDTTGVDQTAGTPHVLNIFGFPSQDDADLEVFAAESRVTGAWDDSDLTDPLLDHADLAGPNSDTLTSSLDALLAGELALLLHTTSPGALPNAGGVTIGGFLLPVAVPEPSGVALLAIGLIGVARRR